MNTNTNNQIPYTRKTTSDPDYQALTNTILSIASLPAAPTFDWTTQAAQALKLLHTNTTFGVVIAQHNHDLNRLNIESSGVYLNQQNQHPSCNDQARSTLERLAASPIAISEVALHSGHIAPVIDVFPQCAATKASIPWTPGPPHNGHHTLVAYAAIPNFHNKNTNTSITLLIFATPNQPSQESIDPTLLSAALAALTTKAAQAIRPDSTGTILWLTQREQAILDQLILGCSVRVIADKLGRSSHTVHDHVKNLHRKLGASSRGQLISRALGSQTASDSNHLITPIIASQLINQQPLPPIVAELKPASKAVDFTKQQAVSLNRSTDQQIGQRRSGY